MSDNSTLLERYGVSSRATSGTAEGGPLNSRDGQDAENENIGSHGWVRGVRERAVSLELRRKTGEILAIPYAYISRLEYQPSVGITIQCGAEKIHIRGRNLNAMPRPLFQGIARHRVVWIQEADHAAVLEADRSAVVVEGIE